MIEYNGSVDFLGIIIDRQNRILRYTECLKHLLKKLPQTDK